MASIILYKYLRSDLISSTEVRENWCKLIFPKTSINCSSFICKCKDKRNILSQRAFVHPPSENLGNIPNQK